MKDLLELINKLGLKKNARKVLEKAVEEQLIHDCDVYSLLPFRMTKAERINAVLLISIELEKKGVLLTGKEKATPDFSILDHPPFCFQHVPPEEAELIKTVFGQPEKKYRNDFVGGEDEIIFIAAGGISLDRLNSRGKIEKIVDYREGNCFLPTDSLHASVISSTAHFWKLPKEKLRLLPTKPKEAIIERLVDRIFTVRLFLARAESRTELRRKLVNEWMDEFYPDVEIPINTTAERASFILLTRETLGRKVPEKKQKKEA